MVRLLVAAALTVVGLASAQVPKPMPDGFALPPGAIHRFGNRQLRHPEGITHAVVSPDGKLLATMGGYSVVVWDLKTLAAKRVLNIAKDTPYRPDSHGLLFYPDSKSLLIGLHPKEGYFQRRNNNEMAYVYDLETGKQKLTLQPPLGFNATYWFEPGGKELGLFYNDGAVTHFDPETGKKLRSIPLPIDAVYRPPPVSAVGKVVAIRGGDNGGLFLFSTETGKEVFSLLGVEVMREAFSADGSLLVYIDKAGKVHLHDVRANKEKFTFDHPEPKQLGPLLISKDNKTLYFASNHGRLFRWNLEKNEKGPDFGNRHNFWNLSAITLDPDETTLFSFSYDHLIKRWDLNTGNELPLPVGYTTKVMMTTSADGKHLIVSDHEGQVDFWNLATGKMDRQLQKSHLGGINCLAASADGKWLAAGRTSQDVRLFDLATGKVVRDIYLGKNDDTKYGDQVTNVGFDREGKTLLAASVHKGLNSYEIPSGKAIWQAGVSARTFAADPNGRWLVQACDHSTQHDAVEMPLFDLATGGSKGRLTLSAEPRRGRSSPFETTPYTRDLVAHPLGSQVLSAHVDGSIRWWDIDAGKMVHWLKTGVPGGKMLAMSSDGAYLAAAHSDEPKVTIYETISQKKVFTITALDTPATQVLFTKAGLVTSADLAPTLWSLQPSDLPKVDGPADELWEALASDDAEKAYAMQHTLASKPEVALKLFRERIKPTNAKDDRAKFDQWVKNLDSPRFAVRELAEKELTAARTATPRAWLTQALTAAKSDEVRTRLERVLLARDTKPDPNEWRLARAASVLRWIDTAESQGLLRQLTNHEGS